MSSYLDTLYFRNEQGRDQYPQALCNYLCSTFKLKHGKLLLDIGSGKGNHLVGFWRCCLDVCGLDKRKECVEVLTKHSFRIEQCDIEKEAFPYYKHFFDVVFSKSVIEHITNTDNLISEAYRVLKQK